MAGGKSRDRVGEGCRTGVRQWRRPTVSVALMKELTLITIIVINVIKCDLQCDLQM